MKRRYHFTFAYTALTIAGSETTAIEVDSDCQPRAEAKADAHYREMFNAKQRLNWQRLRRDLLSATLITPAQPRAARVDIDTLSQWRQLV